MKIHQLSVVYLAEQDRILVRANTSGAAEMRLWLTRRLMLGLWPLLTRMLTKHLLQLEAAGSLLDTADEGLRKMLADFRKEEFLRQADFETPYRENQSEWPLGEEPLLITDVDASPLPNGQLRLSFNERLPGEHQPRSFRIDMEPRLMQALMHLLEHALTRSQWGEAFGSPAAMEESMATGDGGAQRKPRYLN